MLAFASSEDRALLTNNAATSCRSLGDVASRRSRLRLGRRDPPSPVVYGGALRMTDREDELVAVADGGQLNDAHTAIGLKSGPFRCRPAGLLAIVQPVDQGTRERLRLPTRAPPDTRRVTRAPWAPLRPGGRRPATPRSCCPACMPMRRQLAAFSRATSRMPDAGSRPPSSTIAMRSAKAVATTTSIGGATSVGRVVLPSVTAGCERIGAGHGCGEREARRSRRPRPPSRPGGRFGGRNDAARRRWALKW